MCGIAGEVSFDGPADRNRVQAMTTCIRHRGPDGAASYSSEDGQVSFGFRRLAIVDLTTGDQPTLGEEGAVVSMLNGEIYNHVELRKELVRAGHRFVTDHADSEVVPHGYEEWGLGVLDRLRGMFAIALWDSRRNQLVLARDRLGEKPVYYRRDGRRLRFASELRALTEAGDTVDEDALALYLTYQYIPAPTTILRGVRKLEPGEVATFDGEGLKQRRFWTVSMAAERARSGPPTQPEQVTELIREAVMQRCQADVPVGAFLSGGVDSSVTTALLARAAGQQEVHTFSIGFSDPRLDESAAALRVAQALGTTHHVLTTAEIGADTIERAVDSLDEPLADAAAVPTFVLAETAARFVKVVLTGEGADELFGGYARYRNQHRLRLLLGAPLPIRRAAAVALRQAIRVDRRIPARLPDLLDSPGGHQPREWRAVMPRSLRSRLLPGLGFGVADPVLRAAEASTDSSDIAGSFETDLATWVPEDLLVKVDRTTMAHGLEARPPFLDHVLVEAVLGMTLEERWRPGRDKPILRDFAATLLPPAVANRRKQTFTTPTDSWLSGPLRESSEAATDALLSWGFDAVSLGSLQSRSLGGNRDRGQWAWVMYVLGRWLVSNRSSSSRAVA